MEEKQMNKVILCGRLTRDPEVRYSQGENQTAIARYTLAVDRRYKRQGDEQTADFINCVVFGKGAEFAENYPDLQTYNQDEYRAIKINLSESHE